MYYAIIFIIIFNQNYECFCFSKTSPNSKKLENISIFLKKYLFVQQNLEDVRTVGVFEASENPGTDDIINSFLSTTGSAPLTSFMIINKIPEYQLNGSMPLRLTIMFVDDIQDSVDIVKKLLRCCKTWDIYSKYILIGLNELDEAGSFKSILEAMWVENKLVNLGIVHIDYDNDLEVITYNPFKDEILNLKLSASASITSVFPNKLNNLYGHIVKVAYWNIFPYVYEKDGTIRGDEFDFVMTFLKAINATAKLIKKKNVVDGSHAILNGDADMACLGRFLTEEVLSQSAYPCRSEDLSVLVRKSKDISSTGNLLLIFDKFTWILILCLFVVFHVLKRIRLKFMNFVRHDDIGLKILIFSFSVFNIIFTQAFQCWVTTFLVHPRTVKQINTISDLIESKLKIEIFDDWKPLLTTKLQDQYNFTKIDDAASMIGEKLYKEAYGVTGGFLEVIPYLSPEMEIYDTYHQVAEVIGSAYIVFYLGSNCPYKEALNDITFRSLDHGYHSKDWGRLIIVPSLDTVVATKLKLFHLHNVFFLWSAGIAISILMFSVEFLWYRYRKSFESGNFFCT